jgi:hypothetical protein
MCWSRTIHYPRLASLRSVQYVTLGSSVTDAWLPYRRYALKLASDAVTLHTVGAPWRQIRSNVPQWCGEILPQRYANVAPMSRWAPTCVPPIQRTRSATSPSKWRRAAVAMRTRLGSISVVASQFVLKPRNGRKSTVAWSSTREKNLDTIGEAAAKADHSGSRGKKANLYRGNSTRRKHASDEKHYTILSLPKGWFNFAWTRVGKVATKGREQSLRPALSVMVK